MAQTITTPFGTITIEDDGSFSGSVAGRDIIGNSFCGVAQLTATGDGFSVTADSTGNATVQDSSGSQESFTFEDTATFGDFGTLEEFATLFPFAADADFSSAGPEDFV